MKLLAPALSLFLALTATRVLAQTETETTTTTTVSATPSFMLPSGVSYYVVNPATGLFNSYVVGQPLSPGMFIVEQGSGKVIASTDVSGTLVAITTMPTVLPKHFLVMNGQLVYFSNDYAFRRAQLDQQIAANYAAGRLTNHHVKELREDLGDIANLETKRRSDLTYSRSTIREIERKFARVQGDMARYIADTNSRRARIGIRVD